MRPDNYDVSCLVMDMCIVCVNMRHAGMIRNCLSTQCNVWMGDRIVCSVDFTKGFIRACIHFIHSLKPCVMHNKAHILTLVYLLFHTMKVSNQNYYYHDMRLLIYVRNDNNSWFHFGWTLKNTDIHCAHLICMGIMDVAWSDDRDIWIEPLATTNQTTIYS